MMYWTFHNFFPKLTTNCTTGQTSCQIYASVGTVQNEGTQIYGLHTHPERQYRPSISVLVMQGPRVLCTVSSRWQHMLEDERWGPGCLEARRLSMRSATWMDCATGMAVSSHQNATCRAESTSQGLEPPAPSLMSPPLKCVWRSCWDLNVSTTQAAWVVYWQHWKFVQNIL